MRRRWFSLLGGLALWLACAVLPAWGANADYSALKKFLAARMYSEAYLELLRCELVNKVEDPKLTRLKKDLLKNTRADATKRGKINPGDSAVFTVLADIEFQEGKFDKAVECITKAVQGTPSAQTHYLFAKILYAKGNIPQATDEMEKALQADPGSEVVFEDFQFLYNCKNYGLPSAKRLTGGAGFPQRARPVAAEGVVAALPDNPFENDPTAPPDVVLPPEPQPVPDPMVNVNPPDEPVASVAVKPPDETPEPEPDPDVPPPEPVNPPPKVVVPPPEPPVATVEDPEQKKIKDAEFWFEQAKKKFADRDYDNAAETLKKAVAIFPDLPGKDELQKDIDARKKIETDFKFGVSLYESGKFDLAREPILKAFEERPDKFPEATFYLGKIFILGTERDLKKAKEYFTKFLSMEDINPDLKRDVEWVMIGILTDDEQYAEAYEKFNEFVLREGEYARNQRTFWRLKYTLWYRNYTNEILIGMGIFLGAFFLVFLLTVVPALGIFVFDPVKRARSAFERQNYEKAVSCAEDAMRRGKLPVQVERELLEIAVQSHFSLRNYFKCQDHAKHLLNLFPDNMIAWKYLAKAFGETKDSSDEAITMYETIYKKNPEQKEYLPILCKYYAEQKQFTVESMEIMFDYYQEQPDDEGNVLALAEAYVQSKRMGEEVIPLLQDGLKLKPDNLAFRELLARNFSKKGLYQEASRECLQVLEGNINNMGIHVVYTSCMKKMNMLDEAILQYEEFLRKFPGNPQLAEIITGLRKELEQTSSHPSEGLSGADELSPFSEDILSDGVIGIHDATIPANPEQVDIEGFVEPPPEGFDPNVREVPVPDFLKQGAFPVPPPPPPPPPGKADAHMIPTMDPFADHPGDGLAPAVDLLEDLPLAGVDQPLEAPLPPVAAEEPDLPPRKPPSAVEPVESGKPAGRPGMPFGEIRTRPPAPPPVAGPFTPPPRSAPPPATPEPPAPETGSGSTIKADDGSPEVKAAAEAAGKRRWDDVVKILAPVFAGRRSKTVGMMLTDAYLKQKKPELAKEIIDTLEFDRELMGDEMKDLLYRLGVALEEANLNPDALSVYDIICNVDINFRDTFDRSDRLYNKVKKGG